MPKQLFTNNASAVLTAAISASSTTIEITNVSSFPALENQNFFLLTIFGNDSNGKESEWEIVKCVAKSINSVTVERGAEGTVAKAWPLNTKAELRLSAGFANQSSDHFSNVANPHSVTKAQVGLSNVENTADAAKPVSTAQASAITTAVSTAASDATTKANAAKDAAIAASTPLAHVGAAGSAHAVVTTAVAGFMSGADKTKLDGIAAGATIYAHPANHPASIITQDASNRFVTDAEKTAWNGAGADATSKANAAQAAAIAASTPIAHVGTGNDAHAVVTTTVAGFMSPADKTKLDGLQGGEGLGAFAPISHLGATGSEAHGLASPTQDGFMSMADKVKLNGLPNGNSAIAIASKSVFGGVIVGDGLYVDTTGRISVSYDNVTPRNQVAVINDIGTPGQQGFGVGICPALPAGYTAMIGTNDITHDNYGNYTAGESAVVYVPAFYYKVGNGTNGFAVNRVDVKPIHYFENLSVANSNGYASPFCFYRLASGALLLRGIFVDKYLCSKSETISGHYVSVKNKKWTELNLSWAVTDLLRRINGANAYVTLLSWNQQTALMILVMAHGQASTNTVHCGWYGATNNIPKNPVWASTAVSGEVNYLSDNFSAALTGSGDIFNKTTHNGQNSGIADLLNMGVGVHTGHFVGSMPVEYRNFTSSAATPANSTNQYDFYANPWDYNTIVPPNINTESGSAVPSVLNTAFTSVARYMKNDNSVYFSSNTAVSSISASSFFFNHGYLENTGLTTTDTTNSIYGKTTFSARLSLPTLLLVRPSGSSTPYAAAGSFAAVVRPNNSGLFGKAYYGITYGTSTSPGYTFPGNMSTVHCLRAALRVN